MSKVTRSIDRTINDLKGIPSNKIKEFLEDCFDNIVAFPRTLKYNFKKSFTKKKLVISTLDGGYWDKDEILLHVNFQILVDYVEKELSTMYDCCGMIGDNNQKDKGLFYLNNYVSEDEQSKIFYKEVLELYNWWKITRPNRVDIFDSKEFEPYKDFDPFEHIPDENKKLTRLVNNVDNPLYLGYKNLIDKQMKNENDWYEEDTNMLHRIINIRNGLWT